MPSLVAKLRDFEVRKAELIEEMAANRPVPMPPRRLIEDRLAEWRRLLRSSTTTGRAVLDRVLDGRIVFTPLAGGETLAAYEFEAPTRYDKLFSGLVVPKSIWLQTPGEGAEGIRPEDVYYGGSVMKTSGGCCSARSTERRWRPQRGPLTVGRSLFEDSRI